MFERKVNKIGNRKKKKTLDEREIRNFYWGFWEYSMYFFMTVEGDYTWKHMELIIIVLL